MNKRVWLWTVRRRTLNLRLPYLVLSMLFAALLVVGAAACGAGKSSSQASVASTSGVASTKSDTATLATGPIAVPGSASGSTAHRSSSGAAGFRVSKGDNSVPDFGQEAKSAVRQRVVAALATFLRARAGGEWSRVCAELTRPTRRQLEAFANGSKGKIKGCAQVLAGLSTGPASDRADPLTTGVAAVRVKGKVAFALFYGPHASKYVMPVQDEGGVWKMGEVAPLTYPLGPPVS